MLMSPLGNFSLKGSRRKTLPPEAHAHGHRILKCLLKSVAKNISFRLCDVTFEGPPRSGSREQRALDGREHWWEKVWEQENKSVKTAFLMGSKRNFEPPGRASGGSTR